ncbi:hypothetical protein LX15_001126 [Streptoalloteichus tenebrarius]|uniref:Uncharacterized protein n=1 Tax=Streptoalloteichus tenebrarius (strain ATCC 17920 / DSM 40477 / JCM 4838 / CBS 697.72 / NBRC 16177 / NCIMB 11028 / NRRL B-12390 / A12253. 1 / ISP 5477) TaxID=1933 RepID=A0ABT1HPL0_STRSD|nr:hypothetical protein [Streptoalloteichus tenebrarius]MCP2257441.1 hypothetical protein [Streptoalloteichus tenebrarius]BFE98389.1 hypothetical protein GCM10020241_00650 [Streptoalloteichus tenebrarius]
MDIRLSPPVGVSSVRLGMNQAEARQAMRHWAEPEVVEGEFLGLRAKAKDLAFDIFALFEGGDSVSAIEVWRPESEQVRVIFEGMDVFGLPASDVLRALRGRGIVVDESDPYYPCCPDLALGFNRAGDSGGSTPEGLSVLFESVLVAAPGYYAT